MGSIILALGMISTGQCLTGNSLRCPLSAGPETLYKMGALNPRTSGSGTITATSALFLASRYAATPLQGLMVAVTTTGGDTDTMASMCGSILGAIHGDEWLGHFANSVQDAPFIRKLAVSLVDNSVNVIDKTVSRIIKRDCDEFAKRLRSLDVAVEGRLPDTSGLAADRANVLGNCSS